MRMKTGLTAMVDLDTGLCEVGGNCYRVSYWVTLHILIKYVHVRGLTTKVWRSFAEVFSATLFVHPRVWSNARVSKFLGEQARTST